MITFPLLLILWALMIIVLLGASREECGNVVEHLIDIHNLILLNDCSHSVWYLSNQPLTWSSLCHPFIYLDVALWSFIRWIRWWLPIIISANTSDHPVPERIPKWNFGISEISPDLTNDADDNMAIFSSTLLDIATDTMSKTTPFLKWKAKTWCDEDCQAAKREQHEANRFARKFPNDANLMRVGLIKLEWKKLIFTNEAWLLEILCIFSQC